MVNQVYDIFGRQEKPEVTLCNPDKSELYSLYSLSSASKTILKLRYNTLSEIEMIIPKEVGGVVLPAYSFLTQKRLIRVHDDDIGYFVIVDVQENDFGGIPSKTIRALSLEFTMMSKKLTAFGGTLPLYDVLNPDESVLGRMLQLLPSWSIGTIDATLLAKFRTFDIADTNIYNFLMSDVSDAFGCIFTFNTLDSTISATAVENVSTPTDVFFSHDNLIKNSEFKEIADELTTVLYVYGGGDLDIRTVNPLGTNVIYNFDYYKTTEWMSSGLISSLETWEALISTNQTEYADTLTSLKTALGEEVVLQGELATLDAEYLALDTTLKVEVEAEVPLGDTQSLWLAKQAEMVLKEAEITNKNSSISSLRVILEGINDTLSFSNNFTEVQLVELSYFKYENTYQNENLLQLDSMDADEVQDLAQTLYDQAITILERISQPRYEYQMDTASVLALQEYSAFSAALELGATVTVEKSDETYLSLVLLEMVFDYDNPEGFHLIFSNRLRLDNEDFVFSDLFGQPMKTGTTVKFDQVKWKNWADTYKADVTGFISSALNATNNEIINAENQEIKIYANGLRGREYLPETGLYDDRQVWLTSKTLAFTDDNWATAGLAIGEVDFGGTPLFGVVGDALVGRIIAGQQLSIENENNNFLLDSTGAYLNNASFILTRDDGKSRITLDPSVGILIESNPSGTWNNAFYADTAGNIIFSGDLSGATGTFSGAITAESGTIGGWTIDSDGLSDAFGNYINSDGDIKLGNLKVTGASAIFTGTIYADKLSGEVDWNQIVNAPLPASKFNTGSGYSVSGFNQGTMSGSRVYGGTIGWGGVNMFTSSHGHHVIEANNTIYLDVPLVTTRAGLTTNSLLRTYGDLQVWGNLKVGNLTGTTIGFSVVTPFGNAVLQFSKGVLYGYYYY